MSSKTHAENSKARIEEIEKLVFLRSLCVARRRAAVANLRLELAQREFLEAHLDFNRLFASTMDVHRYSARQEWERETHSGWDDWDDVAHGYRP